MPFAAVGAIGAVAGVAGAVISSQAQSDAANKAANAQIQAANTGADAQVQAAQIASSTELGMFNQTSANMQPFLGSGTLALGDLMALLGMTGPPPGTTAPGAAATGAVLPGTTPAGAPPGNLPSSAGQFTAPAGPIDFSKGFLSGAAGGTGTLSALPLSNTPGGPGTPGSNVIGPAGPGVGSLAPAPGAAPAAPAQTPKIAEFSEVQQPGGNTGLVPFTGSGPAEAFQTFNLSNGQIGYGNPGQPTDILVPDRFGGQQRAALPDGVSVVGGPIMTTPAPTTSPTGGPLPPFPAAGNPTTNLSSILNSPLLAAPTDLLKAPTAAQFQQSPGYQFQLQQGEQAIQDSASAAGGIGGNALKSLMSYGTGLANQDWWNFYTQTQQTNANQYNAITGAQNRVAQTLAGLANSGQNAAGNLGAAGTQTAASIGANTIGAGNAVASGANAAANAIGANAVQQGNVQGGLANNLANNTQLQQLLKNLFSSGTSTQGTNAAAPGFDIGVSDLGGFG